jgi:nucleoside transporter
MKNKKYFQLSVLLLLQFMVWGSWYVTTGTYLLQTLHFSGREVGLVYGAMSVAAFISPLFVGFITDKYFSASKVLAFLHLGGSFCLIAMYSFTAFQFFYPFTLLYAILYLPTFALSSSYVLQQLEEPSKQFPGVRVWGSIGWIIAGNIVGLLSWEKTANPFLLSAALSFILGIYALFLPKVPTVEGNNKATNSFKEFFSVEIIQLFKQRDFLIFMISITLLYAIPVAYYYSFVNNFLTTIQVKNAAGWMSIGQITEVVVLLLLPFFLRHFSFKWVVFSGLFLWGAKYAMFAFAAENPSIQLIWLPAILVHGFAYIFTGLAGQLYIDEKAPRHLRNTAQSIITFAMQGLGTFFGTYFAGWMVERNITASGEYNWTNIWILPAVAGIALSLFFLLLFKQKEKQEQRLSDN